jgi:CRP-like cAMP-binding protein
MPCFRLTVANSGYLLARDFLSNGVNCSLMRPGLETLRDLRLFASFDDGLLARLNHLADLARVGPGEVLFREGAPADQLTILLSGYVTMSRAQTEGGDALTDVIAPVRPLAFATVLLGLPAEIGAKTATSCRLVLVPAAELRAMIASAPDLALPFLDHALGEAREFALESARLKLRSSAQRLAEYLLGLIEDPAVLPARFVLPYEKRYLAGKIGCSQENLSRAFAALRRVGVETQQAVVVIRDVAALRDFARIAGPGQPGEAARAPS